MPRSPKKIKTQPKKPKTDKQVMDGLGSDFETIIKALSQPVKKNS